MYNPGEPNQSWEENQIHEMMMELDCSYEEAKDLFDATETDFVEEHECKPVRKR